MKTASVSRAALLALASAILVPDASAFDPTPTGAALGRGIAVLDGEHVNVLGDGRLVLNGDRAPLALTAGLWVGALVDRGGGELAAVSGTVFSDDFVAVSAGRRCGWTIRYTDVGVTRPGHDPLGLEVAQSVGGRSLLRDAIAVHYSIQNVSDRIDPAGRGWTLRNTYVAILSDPDIGLASDRGVRHSDDHVALADHARGSVAYAFDESGSADDTPVQCGVVLTRRPLHRFAVLRAPEPVSDADRYAWIRGDGDGAPTFDPASSRPADYRFLTAVGPIEDIEPGQAIRFEALFLFGDLADAGTIAPPAPAPSSAARTAAPFPNPVRLSAGRVTWSGLGTGEEVSIYTVAGALVHRERASGSSLTWDLRGRDGGLVGSGVYFYRRPGGREPIGRIVILR